MRLSAESGGRHRPRRNCRSEARRGGSVGQYRCCVPATPVATTHVPRSRGVMPSFPGQSWPSAPRARPSAHTDLTDDDAQRYQVFHVKHRDRHVAPLPLHHDRRGPGVHRPSPQFGTLQGRRAVDISLPCTASDDLEWCLRSSPASSDSSSAPIIGASRPWDSYGWNCQDGLEGVRMKR